MAMAMTVTALTGCGGGETPSGGNDQQANNDGGEVKTEAIELKVWSAEEDLEITKQMCDRFDEEHEEWDIAFDISILGVDETCENVKTDPETAADVFLIPSGSIPEMTAAGLLYPITYDLDTLKSLYSEGAMSACTKDDLLYGIPITPNAWFMYYNKSMYTEDEVKSLDTMMAKDLGDGIANFSCALTNSWYIEAFFYGAGCTLFGPDGTNPNDCTWNNAAGLAAGKYLIGLANNPKYVEDIDGLAGSLMKEGKLGALCSGTWSANDLKEALGENYGACALPTFTNLQEKLDSLVTSVTTKLSDN